VQGSYPGKIRDQHHQLTMLKGDDAVLKVRQTQLGEF